jgi:hypothetical protein
LALNCGFLKEFVVDFDEFFASGPNTIPLSVIPAKAGMTKGEGPKV